MQYPIHLRKVSVFLPAHLRKRGGSDLCAAMSLLLTGLAASMVVSAGAHAYIDLAPTLAKIISDSKTIALIEVVEFDRDRQLVTLGMVRALKGEPEQAAVRHQVASSGGMSVPRSILQWAQPGARAVAFVSRNTALVCLGRAWYQVRAGSDGAWKLAADRPDLPLAYYGTVSRLADGITLMVEGKDAVLTTVAHGSNDLAASFDLALNRTGLPGVVKVERIRANLKMPPMVIAASANPAYVIGQGPVDEADLSALVAALAAKDASVRAEAAEELGWLGSKADAAAQAMAPLLGDASSEVRTSAAAALLRIRPSEPGAMEVLSAALASAEPRVRYEGARAAGLVGTGAAPLVSKLAGLLKDAHEPTRIAALQALSILGPLAAGAVDSVAPLLDEPAFVIDAADALGRIGSPSRPALGKVARMLSSDEAGIRWAGVRAMSQIGGENARPAVDFMIRVLPNATEVEGYNMMIYLALLGPVARDAVPTISNVRIKNPVLPSATLWAIESDRSFPWLSGGRFGPPGGPPGGGPGMGGDAPDFARFIYESYVSELGDRLRPAARALAGKIMDGSAGDVPAWGYKILACARDETVATFTSHLDDEDLVMRERATVALGYMGAVASSARDRIAAALSKAPSDREKLLIQWCLGEIEGE